MSSRLSTLAFLVPAALSALSGCAHEEDMEAQFPRAPMAEEPVAMPASFQGIPLSEPTNEIEIGVQPQGEYADADPSAVTEFKTALEPHGTWAEDTTYGTVWTPSAAEVGTDFSPYVTAGHWTYEDDYVWVSDYAWGWAPFHYGRWVYITGRGWSWIPGRAYRGAWVSWRVGPAGYGYVGWGPMAPSWYWRGGVAVSLYNPPPPAYVFCPTHAVFDRRPAQYVVARPQVPAVAAPTREYVSAAPSVNGRVAAIPSVTGGPDGRVAATPSVVGGPDGRVAATPNVTGGAGGNLAAVPRVRDVHAGPPPSTLGVQDSQVVPPPRGDVGLLRAQTFAARPQVSTSTIGSRAPTRIIGGGGAVAGGSSPGGGLPEMRGFASASPGVSQRGFGPGESRTVRPGSLGSSTTLTSPSLHTPSTFSSGVQPGYRSSSPSSTWSTPASTPTSPRVSSSPTFRTSPSFSSPSYGSPSMGRSMAPPSSFSAPRFSAPRFSAPSGGAPRMSVPMQSGPRISASPEVRSAPSAPRGGHSIRR